MLIDFRQVQLDKFLQLATQIVENPADYLQFDSVSDFYKATWLDDFPIGTTWYASGLDDGAEIFDAILCYAHAKLIISCGAERTAYLKTDD